MLNHLKSITDQDLWLILIVGVFHLSLLFGLGQIQKPALHAYSSDTINLHLTSDPLMSATIKGRMQQDSKHLSKIAEQKKPNNNIEFINEVHPSTEFISESSSKSSSRQSAASSTPSFASRNLFDNPRPSYPLKSRRMGEQGMVRLKLCIDTQGLVESIALVNSSGYEQLDQSALNTVKTWRFSVLNTSGSATDDCYRIPIYFKLEG